MQGRRVCIRAGHSWPRVIFVPSDGDVCPKRAVGDPIALPNFIEWIEDRVSALPDADAHLQLWPSWVVELEGLAKPWEQLAFGQRPPRMTVLHPTHEFLPEPQPGKGQRD